MMKKLSRLFLLLAVIVAFTCITGNVDLNAKTKTKTVGTVKALEAELNNETVGTVVLKTGKKTKLTIPVSGHSELKDLIIEAPNANIENNAVFNSITIKSAKSYTETVIGNSVTVKTSNIAITVSESALINKLTVYSKKADITLKTYAEIMDLVLAKKSSKISLNSENGFVENITINKKAQLTIKGKTDNHLTVRAEAKGSSLITSVPVYLYADKNMKLTLKKGAGNSKIVYGNENVNVKINNKSGVELEKNSKDSDDQNPDHKNVVDEGPFAGKETSIQKKVITAGIYSVWEDPSNVIPFKGADGSFYFAVDGDKTVTIYKVKNGEVLKDTVQLSKVHKKFGTVTCDEDGYFYLVTGENNEKEIYTTETVFVSKYDSNGKHIKTAGFTGRTGEIQDDFNTKYPFDAGNCSAVVMNGVIAVNYARGMYNGHQSNNVFAMNTSNLSAIEFETFYNSHSFAQRAISIPEQNTFVFASHGDGFPRCDRIGIMKMYKGKMLSYKDYELFHFWCPKDDGENNTYASMGGIVKLSYNRLALVGESAVSISRSATNENREIFIQIFNPLKDLYSEDAYYTKGERSGVTGIGDANRNYTNYGVKWLTSYGEGWFVSNVQVTTTDDDRIVIVYELYKSDKDPNQWPDRYSSEYQGVYYMVLDANGEIISDAKLYDKKALLNPYQMPVFADGKVCWVANKYDTEDRYNEKNIDLYLYELDPGPAPEGLLTLSDGSDVKKVVAIDKNSFPDDNFREYVSAFADINSDQYLDENEIANLFQIDFSRNRELFDNEAFLVSDLKGIEYFTSLEYLNCSDNQLTKIDVSQNANLKHLDCSKNKLTDLDVKSNKALVYLDCHENKLTAIDVSNNTMLECFKCNENMLKYVDVSKNTELTVFACGGNDLQGIDVSKNTKLVDLNCACNWGITSIDVSNNKELQVLICYCASIKKIDVSNNKELVNLNFGINQVSSVDLSNNTKLEFLGCCCNQFETIDLSHNQLLRTLELSENKFTKLDFKYNLLLEYLYCDKNNISSIDISCNTRLLLLQINDNKLTKLDLSNNPELEVLNCRNNPLQSIDISRNAKLQNGFEHDDSLRITK